MSSSVHFFFFSASFFIFKTFCLLYRTFIESFRLLAFLSVSLCPDPKHRFPILARSCD